MSFLPNRFCKLIPGVGDFLGKIGSEKITKSVNLLNKVPGMEPIKKEELFYIMETKGNLHDLEERILKMQASVARQDLFLRIISGGDENPVVKKTVEFIMNNKIEEAEEEVRRAMEENPEETKKIIERYSMSLPQILKAVESEEMLPEEGALKAQPFFEKNPFVLEASKQTGFEVDKVASVASGVFIKTKEMPRSSADLIGNLMDSMRGMMNFSITKRASKEIGIEKSTIRSVYGINVFEFSEIVKKLKEEIGENLFSGAVNEENEEELKKRLKDKSVHSTERRVINFILKNRNNPGEIHKLYEYVMDEKNIKIALKEIGKTFRKAGIRDERKLSESEIKEKSVAYFEKDLTVGKMLKTKFSLKKDRETLASYTLASMFYTMPKAFRANIHLKTLHALFRDPKRVAGLQKMVGESWFLGRRAAFKRGIETIKAEKMYGFTDKGAELSTEIKKTGKGVRRIGGSGRMLKLLGPGMLAASEVYNVSTGRSTVQGSVGRFAGGMLRFVPVVGTGLDFSEAISGEDQLNGQKLTTTERVARVGWGVLGAISDVAMLIPGLGVFAKTAFLGARAARITKAARLAKATKILRYGSLSVGVGAGVVAPLVMSPEMRGAVGAMGTIGVTGAKGVRSALRLLTGPGGGALDADIALSQYKKATVNLAKKGAKKIKETAKSLKEKTEEFLEKHDNVIGSWGTDTKARFAKYMEDKKQFSKLDNIKKIMEREPYVIEEIFSDNSLSTTKRHEIMSEYIESNKKGKEF